MNTQKTRANLWECLTRTETEEFDNLIEDLGASASLSGQELSLRSTNEGWVITVHACYEDGKVEILIPEDRTVPVKILKDTRADSEPYRY